VVVPVQSRRPHHQPEVNGDTMKKDRADGATALTMAMQAAAQGVLAPPPHVTLKEKHWPYWVAIINARATQNWTAPDLEIAALLARCKCKIEELEIQLEVEGDTVTNARGTVVANPLHQILETHCRRMASLSRQLHVHAEATGGKARKEKPSNNAAQGAREALGEIDDDEDLIPGMH
jgi:hypothetical protein